MSFDHFRIDKQGQKMFKVDKLFILWLVKMYFARREILRVTDK